MSHVVVDGRQHDRHHFPVLAMTFDSDCQWLAVLSPSGIGFWSLAKHQWAGSRYLDSKGRRVELLHIHQSRAKLPDTLVVWRDGSLTNLDGEEDVQPVDVTICLQTLTCGEAYSRNGKIPSVSRPHARMI